MLQNMQKARKLNIANVLKYSLQEQLRIHKFQSEFVAKTSFLPLHK